MHDLLSVSVYLFSTFVCMNLYMCVCISRICVHSSLIQSSYCSVTAGRRAARKGRDFWLKSISLTPETSDSFFCQKAKNIRKRTFFCVADIVGEVGSVLAHGRTRGKEVERGRLSVSTDCLQDTCLHVSECLCVYLEFFFLWSQVAFYNSCHFCGDVGRSQLCFTTQEGHM